MKKLALALGLTATALTFAAAGPASAEDVKLRVGVDHHRMIHRAPVRHVVVVRHDRDRGLHRGWEHARAKKIVIKHQY
jgi:hypothetical protein